MKYFVFSDVHGYYSVLKEELIRAGFDEFNPNHKLISIGDNFDRGPENYLMFSFLKRMKANDKIILIRGNHEDLLLRMLQSRNVTLSDIQNGTYDTIEQFAYEFFKESGKGIFFLDFSTLYKKLQDEEFFDLLYGMSDYFETEKYVFTHGFIPLLPEYNFNPMWRLATKTEFEEARWTNGMRMSIEYNFGIDDKKIVVGHWHTSYGHIRRIYGNDASLNYRKLEFAVDADFSIYEDSNVIAIDAATAYTNQVNIFVFEE